MSLRNESAFRVSFGYTRRLRRKSRARSRSMAEEAHYGHSMKALQRAADRSAAGAAAYRGARRLVDPRTGSVYDYLRRRGVVAAYILVPGSAENEVDAQELWGAVELSHRRKDAVVAREIRVSLPHQLPADKREALTMLYARELSARYGVAVDVCIHLPTNREGAGDRNHHAHLLMSACSASFGTDGLRCGTKVEILDPIHRQRRRMEPICEEERERWCVLVNAALAAAGIEAVADHRSHRERGTGLLPEPKLGPAGLSNLNRWIESDGETPLLGVTERWLDVKEANDAVRHNLEMASRSKELASQLRAAQVVELPTPDKRAVDEPMSGPTAEIVPLRPLTPTTESVMTAVERLWRSLQRVDEPDQKRVTWATLRLIDTQSLMQWGESDPWSELRTKLDKHPELRQRIGDELAARGAEIDAYERESASGFFEQVDPDVADVVRLPEVQEAPSLDRAMKLLERLDRALSTEDQEARRLWLPLRIADRRRWIRPELTDRYARLRVVLSRDVGTRTEFVREVESRLHELEALEALEAAAVAFQNSRDTVDPGALFLSEADAVVAFDSAENVAPTSNGMPATDVRSTVTEFLGGYHGNVKVELLVTDSSSQLEAEGVSILIDGERWGSKPEVIDAIAHEIHRRFGLRTLRPVDRAALLMSIVAAADSSPGLRAAWAEVDHRYPHMSTLDRAEQVFAIAAQTEQGMLGRAWDKVLAGLALCLRAVGLLRKEKVLMAELRVIAREIATGIGVSEDQVEFPAHVAEVRTKSSEMQGFASPTAVDIKEVVALALRLDAALPSGDSRRDDWVTLSMLNGLVDRPVGHEELSELLASDCALQSQIADELRRRAAEIDGYENSSSDEDQQGPSPH